MASATSRRKRRWRRGSALGSRRAANTISSEPDASRAAAASGQRSAGRAGTREVDPSTAMPELGLTEEDARDIAAYLATLD
ncbi:MAG: c-type cytochrome [Variovorax sp.]|nr:MAG: c-type cytochrome [Variovorax sp.]